MNRVLFLLFFLSIWLTACINAKRAPSSDTFDEERINRIQEIDLELSKFWNFDWHANQKFFQSNVASAPNYPQMDKEALSDPQNRLNIEALLSERSHRITQLSSKLQLHHWSGSEPWIETQFHNRLFNQEEAAEVNNWEDFELGRTENKPFPLEHRLYSSYTLRFDNFLPAPGSNGDDSASRYNSNPYLKAQLDCDGDVIYDDGFLFFTSEKRSKSYSFNWYFNKINGYRVRVKFSPDVTHCQFKFYDPGKPGKWTHGFELVDLTVLSKEWSKLTSQIDVCARPQADFGSGPANFFWKQDFMFTTCPQSIEKWIPLRDPYQAINQKILALTGAPLNRAGFDQKDPITELSLENAPQFDTIWVSSLHFYADFYGMVLAKALRYHALKGTQIRILVSEVTMGEKDKNILKWLQKSTPNVKVQYYKYNLSDENDGGWLDKFHRVNHTKLLIGYSATNPDANFLITGGRNIGDSYIFKKKPFYRRFKFLKNYGDGEEDFIYYDDFEIEVRGTAFIKSVLGQMLSLWMRDPETQRARPTNINLPKETSREETKSLSALSAQGPLARHIVSIPYSDGNKLEKFYLEMINSAKSELLMTTPYFRPSVALSAALDSAYQRGVKVKIMTRIHLAGDAVPKIAEHVNKAGINRHLRNIDILEWTDPKSILHAKIIVIDKKLSFISGVNLNRRSFIHDTESGVLILNEETADQLRKEVLSFFSAGRKLTSKEKISWINGILIDWADSYF